MQHIGVLPSSKAAGVGRSPAENGYDHPPPALFTEFVTSADTAFHIDPTDWPKLPIDAEMARTMRPRKSEYSMAVAPDSSRRKFKTLDNDVTLQARTSYTIK